MDAKTFHQLQGPTTWASAPSEFSFSSLRDMEGCPLRWQLTHSKYGELKRCPSRAIEAAVVGLMVHDVLEALVGALTERGLPEPDSDAWCDALASVRVMDTIRAKLSDVERAHATHPRDPGFKVRRTPREISNEVLALLRSQYARARRVVPAWEAHGDSQSHISALDCLRRRGMLAEHPVRHPTLPLRGTIDLVVRGVEGTRIVDFKTGALKPEYRNQLELYATMWFRETGDLPMALEISHGEGVERYPFDAETATRIEAETRERVERMTATLRDVPAVASAGEHCTHCGVRAFCTAYWGGLRTPRVSEGTWMDAEVTVQAIRSESGLEATTRSGETVAVTWTPEVGRRVGPFASGDMLRILGAWVDMAKSEVRLSAHSEVFRRASAADLSRTPA